MATATFPLAPYISENASIGAKALGRDEDGQSIVLTRPDVLTTKAGKVPAPESAVV
jgi:hypothetical protein